jgi:heme/copper-type cytochrome/quinol oxidase subunit 2
MKYVSLIIAVLIIELFIIIGCFIARWKNKNNVDVDYRRKIEDITLLIFWMSLFAIVVIMTGILLKIM